VTGGGTVWPVATNCLSRRRSPGDTLADHPVTLMVPGGASVAIVRRGGRESSKRPPRNPSHLTRFCFDVPVLDARLRIAENPDAAMPSSIAALSGLDRTGTGYAIRELLARDGQCSEGTGALSTKRVLTTLTLGDEHLSCESWKNPLRHREGEGRPLG
jgi:hypothetical protein